MGKDKKHTKDTADERKDKHSGTGIDPNPKKGGAGGKYTWGKGTGGEEELKMDPNDPLYDSQEEEGGAVEEPNPEEFKKVVVLGEGEEKKEQVVKKTPAQGAPAQKGSEQTQPQEQTETQPKPAEAAKTEEAKQ